MDNKVHTGNHWGQRYRRTGKIRRGWVNALLDKWQHPKGTRVTFCSHFTALGVCHPYTSFWFLSYSLIAGYSLLSFLSIVLFDDIRSSSSTFVDLVVFFVVLNMNEALGCCLLTTPLSVRRVYYPCSRRMRCRGVATVDSKVHPLCFTPCSGGALFLDKDRKKPPSPPSTNGYWWFCLCSASPASLFYFYAL